MSHAHFSSLLHRSLASPLETSTEGSLYIDEIEELKRKCQLLSDAIIEISDGRVQSGVCQGHHGLNLESASGRPFRQLDWLLFMDEVYFQ